MTMGGRLGRAAVVALAIGLQATAGAWAAGGEDSAGGSASGPLFVRVKPVVISVLTDGGLAGKMSASFYLEAHDGQAQADIAAAQRQLHDAYLQAMQRLAEREQHSGTLTTIRQVKDGLQRATDKVLGKGRVDDVLIQAFVRKSQR